MIELPDPRDRQTGSALYEGVIHPQLGERGLLSRLVRVPTNSGLEAFIRREALPYTPDAWIKEDATKVGYEVSFTRHFYQPQPLRTLEEISADILAIEKEAEGLLDGLLKTGSAG